MIYDFPRDAACHPANGFDGDLDVFFPVGEPGNAGYDHDVAAATAVCAGCPVRDACLRDALDAGHEFGVFGGLDAPERRALVGTPADVLLARYAAAAAARAEEDARIRAAARPIDPVGRAVYVRPARRRQRGYCPVCGTYQWVRLTSGGMGAHLDQWQRDCPGIDRAALPEPPEVPENTIVERLP